MEQWGLQIDIASIQEVLPMINLLSDILTVVSIIVYVIQKVLELGLMLSLNLRVTIV